MCLAEDNNIFMTYTDTDSIHMDDADIKKLSDLFKEKYQRELIGNKLGQFHCDFDFKCDAGILPVAVESYFLGKKSYIDKIKIIKDKKIDYKYHIRLKGIPNKCINEF